jgi:hypothetical protein
VVRNRRRARTSLRHALAPVEKSLGRSINATIFTVPAWRACRSRVAMAGVVMVLGTESDLDA